MKKKTKFLVKNTETGLYMGEEKGKWTCAATAKTFRQRSSARLVANVMSYVLFSDCIVVEK